MEEVVGRKKGSKVLCPGCKSNMTTVVDSRNHNNSDVIRRRRLCMDCSFRWTTYEITEQSYDMICRQADLLKRLFPYIRRKKGVRHGLHARPLEQAPRSSYFKNKGAKHPEGG